MKKTIKSLLAIAISAFAFAACSDVPAPYDTPSEKPVNPHAYTGDGSVANPYTVADAIYLVQSLDGNETDQAFCVKGKVVAVSEAFNTQYGNGTFTISDDGAPANIFTAYRVYYLGNKKYTATDAQIQPGDDVIIYGKLVNYRGNTPETVQGTAFLYELNGVNRGGIDGGGGGGESADQPKGTGTVDNPFNVAAAVAKCQEAGGTATSQEYYVTGIVDAEYTVDNYKNATFDMVDNGFTQKFKAYRVVGPNGESLKEGYKIPKGATVVVCGKLVNYGSSNPTPETSQGSGKLISVNGQAPEVEGGGGDVTPGTPSGSGTQADPFNVAAAVKKCNELGADVASTEQYYIKGIANADYEVGSYKNIEVDIVDQAGSAEKFKVFRVKRADGQGIKQGYKINKGDLIIVYGPVINYKGNTPETATGAYIVSVNGLEPTADDGQSGGGDSGGGAATELTNGNFETWESDAQPTGWKSASSASSATLAKSTDAHGGSFSCIVKGDAAANKRLGSQEIKLAAGTYNFSIWVKPTTSNVAQVRPGYVPIDATGKAGSYKYGDYATLTAGWQQVSTEFTLDAETTVCLVVMNPKASNYSSGEDVLVDDATLTKK